MSVEKLLRKRLLKEYIESNVISLRNYMNMSEDAKKEYLPEMFYWHFDNFLDETGIDFPYEDDLLEVVEGLQRSNPELYKQFAEWLYKGVQNMSLNIADSDYPAWSFFDFRGLVKNQWLIHFTNDADSIAKEGFKYGVDEMDKLGLTCHLSDFDKKYGGYNFAYTINDYVRYAKSGQGRYTFKYGDEAVIFRASGIKLWHWGDEEPQVIFYGNTARDIISITSGENAAYGVRSKRTGVKLFESDEFDAVVNWIIKNYNQYRKHF